MDSDAEIKRKLRKLKKLEARIRFGFHTADGYVPTDGWVWDRFFNTHDPTANVKYPMRLMAGMDRETYRRTVDEFLYYVCYRLYKEASLYDPELLAQLGLPPDAGADDVRKKFRALAKKYHPDAGGDSALFIALKEQYDKLMGK